MSLTLPPAVNASPRAFFIPIVGVVCLALDSYLMLRQTSEYMRS